LPVLKRDPDELAARFERRIKRRERRAAESAETVSVYLCGSALCDRDVGYTAAARRTGSRRAIARAALATGSA
jgi:hypothetical protein